MTRDIIEKIIYFMEKGESFVLVTILKSSGSAPRSNGIKMVISQNGTSLGSIGGGLLEAKMIQAASKTITTNRASIINMALSSEEAGGMGMLCGGKVSVMIDPIFPKKNIKNIFNTCLNSLKTGNKCTFATIYNNNNAITGKTSHHLMYDKNNLTMEHTLSEDELILIKRANNQPSDFSIVELNKKIVVCSLISSPPKAYILGAGHIAQPTAIIASTVGFKVIVMDDRVAFANAKRFPTAHEVRIIDFHHVFEDIDIDKDAFIVIITRGHEYDKIVLEQALSTDASYIGMIGSQKKRNAIFEDLRQKGINEQKMKRINSPIGIDIGSETPEEIALSIVAEMVLTRSGGPKRPNESIDNVLK